MVIQVQLAARSLPGCSLLLSCLRVCLFDRLIMLDCSLVHLCDCSLSLTLALTRSLRSLLGCSLLRSLLLLLAAYALAFSLARLLVRSLDNA